MRSKEEAQPENSQNLKQRDVNVVEMVQRHQDALLVEYQVCQSNAWKWDSAIWQTAAIFFPASLAGFIIVAQIPDSNHFKLLLTLVTGMSAILILVGWYGMARRWEAYKLAVFYRLREIEQELGLWKNRYLEHLRIKKIVGGQGLAAIVEDDKARFHKLEQEFPTYPGISVLTLIRLTVIGLVLGWVSLLIFEVVSTLVT